MAQDSLSLLPLAAAAMRLAAVLAGPTGLRCCAPCLGLPVLIRLVREAMCSVLSALRYHHRLAASWLNAGSAGTLCLLCQSGQEKQFLGEVRGTASSAVSVRTCSGYLVLRPERAPDVLPLFPGWSRCALSSLTVHTPPPACVFARTRSLHWSCRSAVARAASCRMLPLWSKSTGPPFPASTRELRPKRMDVDDPSGIVEGPICGSTSQPSHEVTSA